MIEDIDAIKFFFTSGAWAYFIIIFLNSKYSSIKIDKDLILPMKISVVIIPLLFFLSGTRAFTFKGWDVFFELIVFTFLFVYCSYVIARIFNWLNKS